MDNEMRGQGRGGESRGVIDARVDTPGREGLTGTAPANLFTPVQEPEQMTIAPDWLGAERQPAWRQDFPIDWPRDHYVERRDFVKFLVLTSLALTVGQFWIAVQSWWGRRRGAPGIQRIAALSELAVGGVLTFTYPGPQDDCVLVRTAQDALVAYSQKCTHLSCAVRPLVAEGVIHCPCHEGYFDLRSGRPLAGPPRRPLPLVRIDVRDNQIYATGVEKRTV
ncbi:MAG: ubiquinol-cytochrome c reductase iron-sulfur subunit [Candidatus Binatia bacterium]